MPFNEDVKESDIQMHKGKTLTLRYFPILVWMRAAPHILEQRVSKRIDEMIDRSGGLDEIVEVFNKATLDKGGPLTEEDFEKGIL